MTGTQILSYQLVNTVTRPPQPWLSKTSFENLENAQRFAGRIITGHLKTTPNECILLDTSLTSMVTKCRQNAVIALEKSKRLPSNNPRRQVIERQVKQRTTKPSWRNGAIKAWEEIFENEDHTSPFPPERKPWTDTTKISFRYSETKKSDSELEQRKAGKTSDTGNRRSRHHILHGRVCSRRKLSRRSRGSGIWKWQKTPWALLPCWPMDILSPSRTDGNRTRPHDGHR